MCLHNNIPNNGTQQCFNKKQTNKQEWAKNMNRHFTKGVWMAMQQKIDV